MGLAVEGEDVDCNQECCAGDDVPYAHHDAADHGRSGSHEAVSPFHICFRMGHHAHQSTTQ